MKPEEIFQALSDESVEYVLVGGLAASAHGASLVTFDIDICFRQEHTNCERLARALRWLGAEIFPTRQEPILITPELLETHRLVHLRTRAGRLDLLVDIPGLGRYEELIPEATRITILGLSVPVLTLDQLIKSKSALQQPKDRQHLDQLLALKQMNKSGEA